VIQAHSGASATQSGGSDASRAGVSITTRRSEAGTRMQEPLADGYRRILPEPAWATRGLDV
jgi:hypothetical protein